MTKSKKHVPLTIVLVILSAVLLSLPLVIEIPKGETNPWIEFIGLYHPVFLHLPIGFLLLIVSIELYHVFTKKKNTHPMRFALVLNALASVNAALLGFVLYLTGSWSTEKIEDHLWSGLAYAVCSMWLPHIYSLTISRSRVPYMALLLGSAAVMNFAGHEGGLLTHGDPMDSAPWKPKEEKKRKPIASPDDLADGEVFDPVFYTDVVVPIFEEKCYSCHGEKRGRGGLRMHEMELFLEGGDEEIALEPGNVEESFFLTSLHLPLDDDYHMPPENKPQVTEREAKLLEFWVASGATVDKKLSELDAPEDIIALLNASADVADAEEAPKETKKADSKTRTDELTSTVAKAQESLGTSLNWLSLDSPSLQFSAVSIRKQWNNEHIDALKSVATNLESLNLNGTTVGDDISSLLEESTQLRDLRLAETSISNEMLKSIPDSLEVLNLHSTQIDDSGVMHLQEKKNLKRIYLWNSKVTEEGKKKLSEMLPELEIL